VTQHCTDCACSDCSLSLTSPTKIRAVLIR
jgi:hypothetical protein